MAQAPQDPYQGLQGFRIAWANLAHWVTTTLPAQWDELQAIIDYVNGRTAPEPPPPPPPDPVWRESPWPVSAYTLDAIKPMTIADYNARIAYWGNRWAFKQRVVIAESASFDGHPEINTVIAVLEGFDIMVGPNEVTVWPGGTGEAAEPGAIKWVAGWEVRRP